jgi:hypothetical protein
MAEVRQIASVVSSVGRRLMPRLSFGNFKLSNVEYLVSVFTSLFSVFRSCAALRMEILARRGQIGVLRRSASE